MTTLIRQGKTELALPPAKNQSAKVVSDNMDRMLIVLPSDRDRLQYAANAVTEVNGLNGDPSAGSVQMCVFNSFRMGLMFGPMGHCYLVPFKKVCTLVIGYKGYLELAYSNNFLQSVYAEIVLDGEEFKHWVDDGGPHVKHDIPLNRDECTRRNLVGAYCVYTTRAGGRGLRVLNRKQIDKLDSQQNVWKSNYQEMVRKSPLRACAKDWKLSPQMALAVAADEAAERGEFLHADGLQQPTGGGALSFDQPTEPADIPGETVPETGETETGTCDYDLLAVELARCNTPGDVKQFMDFWSDDETAVEMCGKRMMEICPKGTALFEKE